MNKSLIKTAALCGLAASIVCALYLFVLAQMDFNPFGRFKYMMYTGLYAVFFIGGMKYFRDKINAHQLRPQQGLSLGIVLNIVAAVLIACFTYLFLLFGDTNQEIFNLHISQLKELLEFSKENLIQTMGEESFKEAYSNIQEITISDIAIDLGIGLSMAGLFHTFLFMLIFKTRQQNQVALKKTQ